MGSQYKMGSLQAQRKINIGSYWVQIYFTCIKNTTGTWDDFCFSSD